MTPGRRLLRLFAGVALFASLAAMAVVDVANSSVPGANGRIVYRGSVTSDIYAIDPDGSDPTRLTVSPGENESDPAWSPDGTKIAFTGDAGNHDVFVMNADGSGIMNLTNNAAGDREAAWSPDGAKLAFATERSGVGEIWTMDADGTNQAPLIVTYPASNFEPAWSPDGSRLAFVSNRDGDYEIYVASAAGGGEQTRLTDHSGSDASPAWSPDGSQLTFARTEPVTGRQDIAVMDADGSEVTLVTQDQAADARPSWSPDGMKLAWERNLGGQVKIVIADIDGSGLTTLTSDPSASPDWQAVAPSPPSLSIDSVAINEGDGGTTDAVFTVSLSAASDEPAGVDYATADGTATAGSDYQSRSGTLEFPRGETTQTIAVPVAGDVAEEPDEFFTVELSNPTGATTSPGLAGVGTVIDDDETPLPPGCTRAWDGGAGSSSWGDAANWKPDGVPVATDNVCIPQDFSATVTVVHTAGTTSVAGLKNAETLVVSGGSLTVTGPFTNGGSVRLESGAAEDALRLKGSGALGGGFALGDRRLSVEGGDYTLENNFSASATTGKVTLRAGTLWVLNARTLNAPLEMFGGTVTGAGTLTLAKGLIWRGGEQTGSGQTVIAPNSAYGSFIAITSPTGRLDQRRLVNRSTLDLIGDFQAGYRPLELANGAVLANEGTLRLGPGTSATTPSGSGSLLNTATVTVTADPDLGAAALAVNVDNRPGATLTIRSSSLTLTRHLTNGGSVSLAHRTLNVVGNYMQEPSGVLRAGIAGSVPGSTLGRLTVTGQASLDGALDVITDSAFTPAVGNDFQLVRYGTRQGQFGSIAGGTLPSGRVYRADYGTTSLSLVVHEPPPPGQDAITAPPTGGGITPLTTLADAAAPILGIAATTVTATRAGVIGLRLSCPGYEPACAGRLTLRTAKPVSAARRRRLKLLGAKAFRIAGGGSAMVRIRLSRRNLRLLVRRKRMRVVATVRATDAAGNSATSTRRLTLKAPKPRPRQAG